MYVGVEKVLSCLKFNTKHGDIFHDSTTDGGQFAEVYLQTHPGRRVSLSFPFLASPGFDLSKEQIRFFLNISAHVHHE